MTARHYAQTVGHYHTATPTARSLFGMCDVSAQLEVELPRERTKAGLPWRRLRRGFAGAEVVLVPVLEDHPDRSIADLLGKPASACHDSILSKNGDSGKPGAVQGSSWWDSLERLSYADSLPLHLPISLAEPEAI